MLETISVVNNPYLIIEYQELAGQSKIVLEFLFTAGEFLEQESMQTSQCARLLHRHVLYCSICSRVMKKPYPNQRDGIARQDWLT